MGDRGNIIVRGGGSQVYLYTHRRGIEIVEMARQALARRQRWDDVQYLTRIVFCTMVEGSFSDETGFGITSNLHDNGHPLLVINCDEQQVFLEADHRSLHYAPGKDAHPMSFENFVALSSADFGTLDPNLIEPDCED